MSSRETARTIRILFVGPCTLYGQDGNVAFPELCMEQLADSFPLLRFVWDRHDLPHLAGLKPRMQASLESFRPDIMVVQLAALYAARPVRFNILAMSAPGVLESSRAFLRRVHARMRRDSAFDKMLRLKSCLFPTHDYRPVTQGEYRRSVEDAVTMCRQTSACRLILMSSGGFNDYTKEIYPGYSPQLCSAVNNMIVDVGARMNVPVVNFREALEEWGTSVYIPDTFRWNLQGNRVVAREVEAVVENQVRSIAIDDGLTSANPFDAELSRVY